MQEALRQARKGVGRTSPNPAVGAVVVRDGSIAASGFHRKAGLPHAEVEALNRLGRATGRDILYVTLEPCNHQGRTPPCTEAILKSGIRRVVVGMKDPNPDVSGGGCRRLRKEGIEVVTGVLEPQCRRLNEAFITYVTRKRPFVALKSALTLDGWTATSTGHSKWITNERSRHFVHRLRDRYDAVMVGIGTALTDDPMLTTRLKRGRGRDPVRIVVDTRLRIPPDAAMLSHGSSAETVLVVGDRVPASKRNAFERPGVSLVTCGAGAGKIDLPGLMNILGQRQITSLLVEGGAAIAGSLIRDRLVDKFYVFMAPKLLGGGDGVPMASGPGALKMDGCVDLRDMRLRRF
ncbi:MAG: bifunctional diaminohydroxyphosphoribosylaminopyrimidine deaminase/5-amino-6-(5-phosphoribosylamino)uracil reductase RibD, partial [Deltaproteobacteria bacterium]|nr:bifunctional diaminohydroxyphosphoribosylaminopyrimidine deaminase/5-amino-6-(5-phosphoribosylamino)uracil reductase RibD [Deltaproteobacteria bacterium]